MEIAAALSGIKGLLELAKVSLDARDDAKVKEALNNMSDKLLAAYGTALKIAETNSELQSALREMERRYVDLQTKTDERAQYELVPLGGCGFAYRSKSSAGNTDHQVYLCQNCYDKGVKSVLRDRSGSNHLPQEWSCAENKAHSLPAS